MEMNLFENMVVNYKSFAATKKTLSHRSIVVAS